MLLKAPNMSQVYTRPALSPHESSFSSHPHNRYDHYTPPEPRHHSEHTNSYLAERQHEGRGWKVPQPRTETADSLRRSTYEAPSVRVGDDYRSGNDMNHKSREQLPPLSSLLFSTGSRQTLPVRPPYSESSPSFPNGSPHEVRRPPTPSYQERQYQESMYQRRPSAAGPTGPPQQYAFSARQEHHDRSGPVPPIRPMQSNGIGPRESPRQYNSRYSPQSSSRTQLSSSTGRWSPRSEHSARQEYFPQVPREQTFRQAQEHRQHQKTLPPPPYLTESDPRSLYRDAPAPAPAPTTPQYHPLTPVSTNVSVGEPTTSKDGLGPKIWTGTQFLPRFVRQAEVPGEGMCYFYDDGTHCKTVIDGEVVNAHWGDESRKAKKETCHCLYYLQGEEDQVRSRLS